MGLVSEDTGGWRWFGLLAGLTLELSSGTSYAFGVYSESLKNVTGFTQVPTLLPARTDGAGQPACSHALHQRPRVLCWCTQ